MLSISLTLQPRVSNYYLQKSNYTNNYLYFRGLDRVINLVKLKRITESFFLFEIIFYFQKGAKYFGIAAAIALELGALEIFFRI